MFTTARFEDSYRTETEDRVTVVTLDSAVVLAVADGVGGRSYGGPAAAHAIRRVQEAVPTLKLTDPLAWYRLLREIDSELLADENLGQTTLAVVAVTQQRVVGASVGDSEAWLIRHDGHYDLTETQPRKPYLGSLAEPAPFSLALPESGTLLIASDGLFKYAPAERIIETTLLPDLEEAAQKSGDLPRLPNGTLPDDLALALCRFQRTGGNPLQKAVNRLFAARRFRGEYAPG